MPFIAGLSVPAILTDLFHPSIRLSGYKFFDGLLKGIEGADEPTVLCTKRPKTPHAQIRW
jgi:hypothetical protein